VNRVLDSLRRFQTAQTAASRRACEALGVPDAALNALRELLADGREDGLGMKELAASVGISPAVATGIVDKLEAQGWAERRPDPSGDRRALVVVATVPEDSPVRDVIRELDEPLRKVANSISEHDAEIVRLLASAMEETLDHYHPPVVRA
jgi:DNA-binding MarR family transcriptional regulator